MRRRMTIVLALVLSALMITSVAFAEDAESTDEPELVLEGPGVLKAHGVGTAVIKGRGLAALTMTGQLAIVDSGGDAVITFGDSERSAATADDGTRIVFEDFSGTVTVEGSSFTVFARGKIRDLTAKGSGVVYLEGRGWWRVKGVGSGHWSPGGLRIRLSLTG